MQCIAIAASHMTSTLLVTLTTVDMVIKDVINEEKTGRGEQSDLRLCRSVLRIAPRASVGDARRGANRTHSTPRHSVGTASRLGGPLPPEGSDEPYLSSIFQIVR